ncbi:hypothetical protein AKJ40_03300 [candidate division MSBL1 archaeon SCGC-AAA259M10]|uniref:CSD domain-containing protein n=1 Tax=candidate division MSBL1 archaeon SCGC-AAA259M10 TaxID=1698270 RepID=A0A133UYT9_9EURY|nr:hypothetical protein AKJ40_03300 [candidate division MSBL1 archaeon SCGC-AAA259M10]
MSDIKKYIINFGFIKPEGGEEDHFVHASDIESGPLNEGDEVEFDSEQGIKVREQLTLKRFELKSGKVGIMLIAISPTSFSQHYINEMFRLYSFSTHFSNTLS